MGKGIGPLSLDKAPIEALVRKLFARDVSSKLMDRRLTDDRG
jgi:hypothetical protein